MPASSAVTGVERKDQKGKEGDEMTSDTPRTDAITTRIFTSEINAEEYLKVATIARQLERVLARYENAKLPEPTNLALDLYPNLVYRTDYDALRTYAASQTVRADEARTKAIEECAKAAEDENCDQTEYACGTVSRILATIRALQS